MAKRTPREFTAEPAVRRAVPILVGLVAPSGGGKTFSALRLAKGIQRVDPGPIALVCTENGRGLHYAERFRNADGSPGYLYVPFNPPFGSLDYRDAIRFAVEKLGARTVIVDSMSHEHEGPGGLLDYHEAELDRMAGDDYRKRDSMKMLAWSKPKADRRALLNDLSRVGANVILCFRAKETAKPVKVNGKTEVVPQGFVPIAGDEFVFEMTLNALLLPGSGGVPTWSSENPGERAAIKVPDQFRSLLNADPRPIDEELGERLAKWARAGAAAPAEPETPKEDRPDPSDAIRQGAAETAARAKAKAETEAAVDQAASDAEQERQDQAEDREAAARAEAMERAQQTQAGGIKGDPQGEAGPIGEATIARRQADESPTLERLEPVPSKVYRLEGDQPNAQGLVPVYRGGKAIGGVEASRLHTVPAFESHEAEARVAAVAADVEAKLGGKEPAPAIRDNPEDRQPPAEADHDDPEADPALVPWMAYVDALVDAQTWPDVRKALEALRVAAFKEAPAERQAAARVAAYRRRLELLNEGKDRTDVLACPHLFRCYVEAEEDGAALEGNWRAFSRDPVFTGLPAPAQQAFAGAVSGRLAALGANAGAFA